MAYSQSIFTSRASQRTTFRFRCWEIPNANTAIPGIFDCAMSCTPPKKKHHLNNSCDSISEYICQGLLTGVQRVFVGEVQFGDLSTAEFQCLTCHFSGQFPACSQLEHATRLHIDYVYLNRSITGFHNLRCHCWISSSPFFTRLQHRFINIHKRLSTLCFLLRYP